MKIERMFSNVEEEKLYSTGNDELDELLERAFCEGYEYAQREFGRTGKTAQQAKQFFKKVGNPKGSRTLAEKQIREGKIKNPYYHSDITEARRLNSPLSLREPELPERLLEAGDKKTHLNVAISNEHWTGGFDRFGKDRGKRERRGESFLQRQAGKKTNDKKSWSGKSYGGGYIH